MRQDIVWQNSSLVQTYLAGVRGGIPYAADQLDIMLRVLEARGQPVTHFADLGCGGGALAATLLSRYPEAEGVLVDFSEPMLQAAQAALADNPRLTFVTADLGSPDWQGAVAAHAPFDAVVSGYAIHHLPHDRKRALYAEIFDLLAPGGLFINVEHVQSATPWLETLSDDMMIDTLYAFHAKAGSGKTREQVDREFVHRPDKVANILARVEDQCAWLRDMGYQDVDCYFKVFELAVFGGRKPAT